MEFDVAELDLPEFSSAFSLALADPFESPLTVILPFVSAVMPVQSAPLTIMLPSLTVTVPWLAVAGGGLWLATSLALTVTLPLPALTMASVVEVAVAVWYRCLRRSGSHRHLGPELRGCQ